MLNKSRCWLSRLLIILLIPVLLAGCARPNPANTINIAGSTSVQPLSEELANAFMSQNSKVAVNVAGGGSSAGIKAAQEGTAEIGASSRSLKSEEKRGLKQITIAIDGIALVVNPANQVQNLTLDQIRRIYTGEITNWREVGGADGPIDFFTREEGSGTRGAFEDLVMKGDQISSRAGVLNATGALRTVVAGDPHALAYISLGNVDQSVQVVAVDGVRPESETIRDGTYKLARPFVYLTKGNPRGLAIQFIEFVLSQEGQEIVGQGFIPVN